MPLGNRIPAHLDALHELQSNYPGESLAWSVGDLSESAKTVTVDLGRTNEMGHLAALGRPEIVILTHDDEDHIGGWTQFSKLGLAALRELWVPYEWGVLTDIVRNFDPDMRRSPGVHAADPPWSPSAEVEAHADSVRRDLVPPWPLSAQTELHPGSGRSEQVWELDPERAIDRVKDAMERYRDELRDILAEYIDQDGEGWSSWDPDKVAKRTLKRAHRILGIVLGARRAGVRVRYFSVDHAKRTCAPWESEGERGVATIANAAEVFDPRSRRTDLLAFARLMHLTVQNERALCPVLWDGCEPAVLVWSDSTGQWAADPCFRADKLLEKVSVCTAPHHGSVNKAHDQAWEAMDSHFIPHRGVVVLAGGMPNQRTSHPRFMSIAAHRRACTAHRDHEGTRGERGTVRVVFSCLCGPMIYAGGCGS
mgnify:CR=1 FL=1